MLDSTHTSTPMLMRGNELVLKTPVENAPRTSIEKTARNTWHGPRTSLPQRAFHSTDRVQQNISPTNNSSPSARRAGRERHDDESDDDEGVLQKSHVNMVAEFSMASQNSNMAFQNFNMAFQNFNMAFQNSEHGVSKLRTWRFTRCRARTSNDAVEGKGVGQWMLRLTPVYLRPQQNHPTASTIS